MIQICVKYHKFQINNEEQAKVRGLFLGHDGRNDGQETAETAEEAHQPAGHSRRVPHQGEGGRLHRGQETSQQPSGRHGISW